MILNLTQYPVSKEQIEQGVIEPSAEDKKEIEQLLWFDKLPEEKQLLERAEKLSQIAARYDCDKVSVGAAPFFLSYLEEALQEKDRKPVYSFTYRQSVEKDNPETGERIKTSVYIHQDFIEAPSKNEENLSLWDKTKRFLFEEPSYEEELLDFNTYQQKEGMLNLTQHEANDKQKADGVEDPDNKECVKELITFDEMPDEKELKQRAEELATYAKSQGYSKVMIAGAAYFDSYLRAALEEKGIDSYYSFSLTKAELKSDGKTVVKTFDHKGLVPSFNTLNKQRDMLKDDR